MDIYRKENGKIGVDVPISYTMKGTVTLEFDSIEDMNAKLRDKTFVDEMPLDDDDYYADNTYAVDFEGLQGMIDAFQGDENNAAV